MNIQSFFPVIISLFILSSCSTTQRLVTTNAKHYNSFEEYPVYNGKDLGVNYSVEKSIFKLWSPAVEEVKLRIYKTGDKEDLVQTFSMGIDEFGVWSYTLEGDWKNYYYTYQVKHKGKWLTEQTDPYAKGVGVNGKRGMVIDLKSTNPKGWEMDEKPNFNSISDVILYEIQLRDISIAHNSGIQNKGKFLGLTETNTKIPGTKTITGISHIKEMGVTHVHILPSFDFRSINETQNPQNQYNWGYDPQNYNVPEGTFSTNPYDGNIRVKEYKQMVQAFHENNLRVVLDVVYNHTGLTEDSNFNQLVPGYYYRHNADGSFSNASACGNEIASERPMVRKFIVESVLYWAKEYHLDGFRFDLMGIHDIETMNIIAQKLKEHNPTIIVYGEGWTAGDSPLPYEQRALKNHTKQLNNVAVFSDDIRDGIKGHWSNVEEKGFVSGNTELSEVIKFGVVGSTQHPQINYDKDQTYAQFAWSNSPQKVIGYVSCHDNNTLYDKLKIANPNASEATIKKMALLANTIVLTSQSVPFLHMGVEMGRTKQGVENSFESPDAINKIDWSWKQKNSNMVSYYKNLIRLRKEHPAFKMPTEDMIAQHLKFIDSNDPLLVAYTINNNANGDLWRNIFVSYNGDSVEKVINLPTGSNWMLILDGNRFYLDQDKPYSISHITVPAHSAVVLATY